MRYFDYFLTLPSFPEVDPDYVPTTKHYSFPYRQQVRNND